MAAWEAILFDVDGTLLHSQPGILHTFAYTFEQMGLDPTQIDLGRYLGPPLRKSFAEHFSTEAEVERAVDIYRERYAVRGSHECSPFAGVVQMLGALQKAGLILCTATSKPQEVVLPILKEQGILPFFSVVGGASMDKSVDTKTAVIRQVLQSPQLVGRRCLMVGDRQDDMQGAADCFLPAAGVLYGYGSQKELEPWHPLFLAQSASELQQWILESKTEGNT